MIRKAMDAIRAKFKIPKTTSAVFHLLRKWNDINRVRIEKGLESQKVDPTLVLELAVIGFNTEAVKLALKHGGNPLDLVPPFGMDVSRKRKIPLLRCMYNNDKETLQEILNFCVRDSCKEQIMKKMLSCVEDLKISNDTVRVLLKHLIKNSEDNGGLLRDAFNISIVRDDIEFIKTIIAYDNQDSISQSVILKAFRQHASTISMEMAQYLISLSTNEMTLTVRTSMSNVLISCARNNRVEMAKLLLRTGIKVDFENRLTLNTETPLSVAIKCKSNEMINFLLNEGAPITYNFDGTEQFIIVDAARENNVELIAKLFDSGLNIQKVSVDMALNIAAGNEPSDDKMKTLAILFAHGADPLFCNRDFNSGEDAISCCASTLDSEGMLYIMAFASGAIQASADSIPPVFFKSDKEKLIELLEHADRSKIDHLGESILKATFDNLSGDSSDKDMLTSINAAGILLSDYPKMLQECLNKSVIAGSLYATEFCLDAGADANTPFKSMFSGDSKPIIQAAREGFTQIASLLHRRGAKFSGSDNLALESLAETNELEAIKLLSNFGAPLPHNLTSFEALKIIGYDTWTDALDNLSEDNAHLLKGILPRYFDELNIVPMEYLQRCPPWHQPYVLETFHHNGDAQKSAV